MTGRRWRAFVACLAVATACTSSEGARVDPSVAPLEPYVPANSGPVDEVTVDGLVRHLVALQRIADEHGGTRVAGSPGYDASVRYVADVLRATGYEVEQPPTSVPVFEQRAPSVLEMLRPTARRFVDGRDFRAMLFSASGDVVGRISRPTGSGCARGDFAGLREGDVAVIEPASCFRRDQVVNAQAAGASAVIGVTAAVRGRPLRPTLGGPGGIGVPVVAVIESLDPVLVDGAPVRVRVRASTSYEDAASVIAELPGREAGAVVMLGGHLDSVMDGPGINDNGSGVAMLLEISRWLAGIDPPPAVRFAFWAGEEEGLYGSWAYAHALTPQDREEIDVYINLDMVGSPNYVTFVYEPPPRGPPTSERVTTLLERALDRLGTAGEPLDLHGSSDHASFADVGIATAGLYSGSQERKTADQARTFGGAAGEPLDPCFHQACDTVDRVSTAALRVHSLAVVDVLTALLLR